MLMKECKEQKTIENMFPGSYEFFCELTSLIKEIGIDRIIDGFKKEGFHNITHLKENKGSASATNVGIDKATGQYIGFIDSDDMITKDYIETLLKAIEERNEDVIFFDWKDMHTGEVVHHPSNYACWKAIYKKDILPRFRDGWIYSYDVPFQEDLAKLNPSEYYIDKILYIYNSNRPGNLSQKKKEYIESCKL